MSAVSECVHTLMKEGGGGEGGKRMPHCQHYHTIRPVILHMSCNIHVPYTRKIWLCPGSPHEVR